VKGPGIDPGALHVFRDLTSSAQSMTPRPVYPFMTTRS